MDYNTTREKLIMPEYGRHVQDMIEQVKKIPDREKRNEQIKAVVAVMAILNPQLKEMPDFKHKLWDHVQIISGFDIDIDSPFPIPEKESFSTPPEMVPVEKRPLAAAHYGRNIINMIEVIASRPDDGVKDAMIKAMASYMRQQYLIWNKDSVSEETIFKDIEKLSNGKLIVPEHIHLETLSEKDTFSRPGIMSPNGNNRNNKNRRKNGKNRWKNNK